MATLAVVHIGTQWPHYLKDCLHQARLINPSTNILLFVNECHSFRVHPLQVIYKVKVVFLEDLPCSENHTRFLNTIGKYVDLGFRNKYWQYVFERFFFLEDYCLKNPLPSLYMIETDNMLYVPLQILHQTEGLFSQEMAAPFDNCEQGYPSIVYFRRPSAVSTFCTYMIDCLQQTYKSDMKILGQYRLQHPDRIFPYPVLPHSCNTPPRERTSRIGHKATAEQAAFLTHPQFPIVFDAIAYGQALGGIDPRNIQGMKSLGFLNESALYSITETEFAWGQLQGLWIPIVNNMPLVNLHVHSKVLSAFRSDQTSMPNPEYDGKALAEQLQNDLKPLS